MKPNHFLLGLIAGVFIAFTPHSTQAAAGDSYDHWFAALSSLALEDLTLPEGAIVLEPGQREVELIVCDGSDPMTATANAIYYLYSSNGDGEHWRKFGGPIDEIHDATIINGLFVVRDKKGSLDLSNISEDVSYIGRYNINERSIDETIVEFSLIPSGTFTMGSPTDEPGRFSFEETQHQVTLSQAFYMGKTEITWAQWNATREQAATLGYSDIALGRNGYNGNIEGQHPVTEVTWWDVVKWCNLRSELEGLAPVYYTSASFGSDNILRTGTQTPFADWSANGYRLPTEAEWEYACRANTSTAFYTGTITHTGISPLDQNLDKSSWYGGNSGTNTHAVGEKEANDWGLHDMGGNVWEWCWDRYGDYSDDSSDPKGADFGSARVSRGGSWVDPALCCRSALRDRYAPTHSFNSFGFRVARNSNP